MANEAKQFTIGGVTHDVMDVGARQAIASLQAAIDAITSGDTTTAIKTFQEVIDFLDGVTDDATLIGKLNELRTLISAKYSKPANGIPASDLADGVIPDVSGFATKTEVNAKANTADVYSKSEVDNKVADAGKVKSVSVNGGTAQTPDGSGNVNVVVPTLALDDAPTADSNNAVKSGGVKTALDAKANADDVPTKTEMADAIDDAFGEAQVTVVPAGSVGIISSLGSDSEEDALSASMGKKLKIALLQLYSSLGIYAFPNGKPQLDFDGDSTITYTVTYPTDSKVTHTGAGDTVELGSSLEVTLGTNDDLYVIKDNSVKVYMNGVEQSGAYNASTQKVTLAAVTGNVVIVAETWTYVSRGLVMHLDGRNRGGTAGKWKSLVDYNSNPLYFKLENCDEQSDYVAGNGTSSKGTAFSDSALTTPVTLLDVGATEGTIEAAYSHAEIASNGNLPIMHNALGNGNRICLTSWHQADAQTTNPELKNWLCTCTSPGTGAGTESNPNPKTSALMLKTDIEAGGFFSIKANSCNINGNGDPATEMAWTFQSTTSESKLSIFYRRTSNDQYAKYRLYSLRVYSVQLTDAERAQNLAIDQKRFNLS